MKQATLLLFIFCSIVCSTVQAQNPDIKRTYNWYFGGGAGIDFSLGYPIDSSIGNWLSYEGTATISDTCGDLIFYTNGITVWNKEHQIMQNGTGLMGGWSSAQSALIFPYPNNDSLFYVFTADQAGNFGANGFRYSIVNMNLNDGLGDVIIKNILLFSPAMEKVSATYHSNKSFIWVAGRELYSPNLYAYLITDTGIVLTPVISPIGASAGTNVLGDGYMRFSHDGNLLAAGYHTLSSADYDTVDVYNFDNTTGVFSNKISLTFGIPGEVYGVCFSPDNSKLYTTMFTSSPSYTTNIYQFDLSSGIPSIIQSSQTLIYSDSNLSLWFGTIQCRPDQKKLFVTQTADSSSSFSHSLASIYNPNLSGIACGFTVNDFNLTKVIYGGLPNFIDNYFNGNWQPICNTGINGDEINNEIMIQLYPNPASNYVTVEINNISQINNCNIILYNNLGILVRKFSIYQTPFIFYKGNLSEGIYFLKFQINNIIFTKKLIFIN